MGSGDRNGQWGLEWVFGCEWAVGMEMGARMGMGCGDCNGQWGWKWDVLPLPDFENDVGSLHSSRPFFVVPFLTRVSFGCIGRCIFDGHRYRNVVIILRDAHWQKRTNLVR